MKRFIGIFIIALPIIFLSVSCNSDEGNADTEFGEKGYITIRFSGNQLATKATEAGVKDLNENLVSYVDLFFYKTGQTGQNAALEIDGKHATLVSGSTDEYEVKVRYTDDVAISLFGSATSGSCELYVIANGATRTYGSSTAIADLKKTVETQYFGSDEDGIQDNFVMDGQGVVTLATGGYPTGTILLDRAAAKLSLYLSVKPTVIISQSEEPTLAGTWTADMENMTIAFNNASKTGYIDGTYTHTTNDYFNYGARDLATTVAGQLTIDGELKPVTFYTHTPFYSFPESWYDIDPHHAYLLVFIPWTRTNPDNTTTRIVSNYQISANRIDRKMLRNTYYKLFTQITQLGSTDLNNPTVIDNNTFVIKDWGQVDVGEGTGTQYIPGVFEKFSYLVVDPSNIDLYNQSSTSMFYSSSSDVTVTVTKVVYNDYSSVTGAVTIEKTTGLSDYSFTVDGNNTKINYTHSQSDIYALETIYATVTNTEGLTQSIEIRQRPALYIDEINGGNVFVNGYFGRITSGTGTFGTAFTDSGTTYYRCSAYKNVSNYGYSTYNGGTVYSGYGTVLIDYSTIAGGINNEFLTDIHVTSFSSTNNTYTVKENSYGSYISKTYTYKIGDPRVTAISVYPSWTLEQYLIGESGNNNNKSRVLGYWTNPGNVLITSNSSTDQNIIAPEFYICSGLNSMIANTFTVITHRAATFQEAGFPAGRWRLPTEAEIAFIISMQNKKKIPTLFSQAAPSSSSNPYYWAASGRYYDAYNNRFVSASSNTTASCRLVYDTWYWGSTNLTTNVYHPNGHIE